MTVRIESLTSTVSLRRRPLKSWLKFLIPSFAGLAIFFAPVHYDGRATIPLDALTRELGRVLGSRAIILVCWVCIASAAGTIAAPLLWRRVPPLGAPNVSLFASVLRVPAPWAALRVVGGITAAAYLLQRGPRWLISEQVSGNALQSVGVVVLLIYIVSAVCLPLITDYGAMEFFGVLTRALFQRLFKLPGRASLDALASWVSSGPVAILITLRQYESGYYTAREATFIATTFHIVSLPFTLIIAQLAGIADHFLAWYGCLVAVGLALALMARVLPPWRWQPDTYCGAQALSSAARSDDSRRVRAEEGALLWRATRAALEAAQRGAGGAEYVRDCASNLLRTVMGLIGTCIGVVVLANLALTYTPIFTWLSAPLVPLLSAAGLTDASRIAPGFIIGFLDQFLTVLVAQSSSDVHSRFVLASLSASQVIYLSNVGVMLMRSPLAVPFRHLLLMFLVRTVLATPCFLVAARMIM